MAIAGLRGTGDWGPDERPKNFRETILWRQPNGMTPITGLLSKVGSESVNDPEFAWWEEELITIRLTTGAAVADGVTTAVPVVSGATNLVPGDLLLIEKPDQKTYDNEVLEVVSIQSDTAITVARGAAGTTPVAIPSGSNLTKIGNVYSEGTGAPASSTRNPTKFNNYCQIFKTTYELTETAKKTYARTGDPLKNDKKRKMFDHSIALEWAFLLGRKSETTGSNGKPKRTTQGARSWMQTNVTIFGGGGPTLGEDTFLTALYPMFNWNTQAGDERIAFCGNLALNAVNKMARQSPSTRINQDETLKLYGMQLTKWIFPEGTIYIKTHPLLNNHPLYSASMFFFDFSALKYRYLRDTFFKDNVQAPDMDTDKGQWLSECGLEFHHEKTMAYLGNVQ